MPRIQFTEQQVGIEGAVPDYAMQRPNQGFAQLGEAAGKVGAYLQEKQNHDDALDGLTRLTQFQVDTDARRQDLQTQAKTLDGFTPAAMTDFDQRAQALLDSVDNPGVQQFLEERLIASRGSYQQQVQGWEAATRVKQRTDAADGIVARNAALSFENPAQFRMLLGNTIAGLDATQVPIEARDIAKRTATRLMATSAMRGLVKSNPQGLLDQIQAGSWNDVADPEMLPVVSREAEARIREKEGETKGQQREAAAEMGQRIDDYSGWLQQGNAPDAQQEQNYTWSALQPIMGAQAASAATAQLDDARQVGSVTSRLMTSTAVDRAKMLGDAAADLQANPTDHERKAKRFALISRSVSTFEHRLEADPAGVAAQRPEVQQALKTLQAAQENQGDPEQGRMIAAAERSLVIRSLQVQDSLGVPSYSQQPLPAAQLNDLVSRIQNAKPADLSKEVTAITATYGQWSPQVFRQMGSKLSPMTRAAASLPFGGGPGVEFIASSLGTPTQDLKTAIGNDNTKAVDSAIGGNRTLTDLAQSLALRGGGVQSAADLRALLTHAAYARVGAFNEQPDAAVARVVADALGQYGFGNVNGRPFRVPVNANGRTLDATAIQRSADVLLSSMDLKGIDAPRDATSPDAYSSAIRRGGYWVTSDDETGLILYDPTGAPVTRGGKEVSLPWSAIQSTPLPMRLIPQGRAAPQIVPGGRLFNGRGGELQGVTSNKEAEADVVASLRAAGFPEDVANDKAAQWAMLKDNDNTPSRTMKPGKMMALYGNGPGPSQPEPQGMQPSGEQWASRGAGDQAAPVAATRDNTQAALDLMQSIQGDYTRMHELVAATTRDRQLNQHLSDASVKELQDKLSAARSTEDRDVLIGELTDRARSAKTTTARQAIIKELDKHWEQASFKQRTLIMGVHALDAGERGADAFAGMFK